MNKLHNFLTLFFAEKFLRPMAKEFKESPDRYELISNIEIEVDFREKADVKIQMNIVPLGVCFVDYIPMNDIETEIGHGLTLNSEIEVLLLLGFICLYTLSCIANFNDKKVIFKGESPLSHMLTDNDFFSRVRTLVQKLTRELGKYCEFTMRAPERRLTVTRSHITI